MAEPTAIVSEMGEHQHGVVARRQLLDAGCTPAQIETFLARGWLTVLHRGIYAVTGSPDTFERRLSAARLCVGDDAVLSHSSAAQVWGYQVRAEIVEVSVSRARRVDRDGLVVHQVFSLSSRDVRTHLGLPVTSPARTVADLAAVLDAETLAILLERFVMERRTTVREVTHLARRLRRQGRPGVTTLDRVLGARALGSTDSESVLEELFARLCRDHGLPVASFQHALVVEDSRFRLDFAYPAERVAIEIDGYSVHGTRDAFHRDRRRDAALAAAGWVVLRFTYEDLVKRPQAVAAQVLAVLARRS